MGLLFGPFDFGFFLYKARRRAWKSKSNFEFLQPAGCKNSKIRFWSFFIGVYIYIYMHHMHLCIYASMHLCIYASMHLCIYASMHLCIYASVHLCICASMHLCICASMHLCIYASIYLSTCRMYQGRAKRGRRF